jgi:hypothetical protein
LNRKGAKNDQTPPILPLVPSIRRGVFLLGRPSVAPFRVDYLGRTSRTSVDELPGGVSVLLDGDLVYLVSNRRKFRAVIVKPLDWG